MNTKEMWNNSTLSEYILKDVNDYSVIFPTKPKRDCIIMEGVGKEIWDALHIKMDYDAFIDYMLSKYDVDKNELEQDVYSFLLSLEEVKLLKSENSNNFIEMDKDTSIYVGYDENDSVVQEYYLNKSMPYKVFLELTYNCNLRCKHCYLEDETHFVSEYIDFNVVKRFIDDFSKNNGVELIVTGGEAVLHPQMYEILEYACNKNLVVTLLTNGTLFTDELIKKLANLNLYDIQISIYGLEDFHDYFVGQKGAFRKTLKTLKKLRSELNLGTGMMVLNKNNYEQSLEIQQKLATFNIPLEMSPVIFPTIYGNKSPIELRLTDDQVQHAMETRNLRVGGSVCIAGISRFRITPKGEVNPCEMLRHINLGNIYEQSFTSILESKERKDWIETFLNIENEKCSSCNKKQYCFGCLGITYLETGKLDSIAKYPCNLANMQYNYYNSKDEVG